MAQGKVKELVRGRNNVADPPKYVVVFHNDDVTTMEFVILILITVFFYDESKAVETMLTIHNRGSAAVGKFELDIAQSKAMKVRSLARREGFPLKVTVEEG